MGRKLGAYDVSCIIGIWRRTVGDALQEKCRQLRLKLKLKLKRFEVFTAVVFGHE